jgi:hypothetical protein
MSLATATRLMGEARQQLHSVKPPAGLPVFLSYGRDDRAHVGPLVRVMETAGYRVWWDRHIEVGEFFDDRIVQELTAAFAVVVLWSAASSASHWVRYEARRGWKQNKLIPVFTPEFDLDDLRPPFNDLQTIPRDDHARLIEALDRLAAKRGPCGAAA